MHISKVMGKRCCGVHKGDSVKGFLQKEDHTVSPTQAPYPGACCDLIYSRLFGYSTSFLAAQPADLTLRQRMRAEACKMERTHLLGIRCSSSSVNHERTRVSFSGEEKNIYSPPVLPIIPMSADTGCLDVGKAPDNRCTSKSFSIRPPSQCMANIEDRVAYGQGVL